MGRRRLRSGAGVSDRAKPRLMKRLQSGIELEFNMHLKLFDKDGNLKDERIVKNTIGTNGDDHIADQLSASPGESAMSHMAIGTGTPTGTALGTELDRNALTSATDSANVVTYVGDWAAGDGTGAITEAGIFNAAAAGTMLCSASFSVINKGASDTLQIDWDLTITPT